LGYFQAIFEQSSSILQNPSQRFDHIRISRIGSNRLILFFKQCLSLQLMYDFWSFGSSKPIHFAHIIFEVFLLIILLDVCVEFGKVLTGN